jgi:hypothetical protein
MSVLCKKKPSLEQYQTVLHPNESEPGLNRTIRQRSTSAPWITFLFSWCNKFIPKQSRRAMWLSRPSIWTKNLRLRLRKITPKQIKRTKWLNKLLSILSIPGKVFSRSRRVTFRDIQSALDNSKFNECSKRDYKP